MSSYNFVLTREAIEFKLRQCLLNPYNFKDAMDDYMNSPEFSSLCLQIDNDIQEALEDNMRVYAASRFESSVPPLISNKLAGNV